MHKFRSRFIEKLRRLNQAIRLTSVPAGTMSNNSIRSALRMRTQDTVKQSPHKARAHNNLGYAYMLAHRNEDARREFTAALQFDPHYYKARNNLGKLNNQ